jgi:apolipoprotein N-acyltransferase
VRTLRSFALAASGGALYALAFVGGHEAGLWPLALVALAPLWQAIEESEAGTARAALLGFAFGSAAHAIGFRWLWRLVDVFLGGDALLGGALWLAHSSWFASGCALHAALYRIARRRGWPVALSAVPPLLAVEWLWPALFPVYLGSALAERTRWIQLADLGGPLLASAFAALGSVAALETWRWGRSLRGAPLVPWLVAASAAALAAGYGALRIHSLERDLVRATPLRVGIVQANLGALEKRRDPAQVHRLHLEQTRALLAEGPVDLAVWPETVYSRGLQGPPPLSGLLIRGDLRVPLLFGGASVRAEGGPRRRYNSALLIGADGAIRDVYDKNRLVPFAERVVAPLERWFPDAQAFAAGDGTPPLRLGSWRISTPICSESLYPDFVRRMAREARPHLLVVLANDGWFGDSAAPWLHLAAARLRAVEQRRYLVQATNSGVSAVVDPAGRLVARSGLLTRENLAAEVRLLDGETVYARLGDWPGWLALLLCALYFLRTGRNALRNT